MKTLAHIARLKARTALLVCALVASCITPAFQFNNVVHAQSSLTATFSGTDLQTYWLPNGAGWVPNLSANYGGVNLCDFSACNSDHGWLLPGGSGGDLSLGFNQAVTISAIYINLDYVMSNAQCDNGLNDGYSHTLFISANGNSLENTSFAGNAHCAPAGGSDPFSGAPYAGDRLSRSFGLSYGAAGGITLHLNYGLPVLITQLQITYTGCTTQCYNSSGYAIGGGGGGAALPNSCTFGDGNLITGQGPLFYICIAQQFITRQIEPPLAAIYERIAPLVHITFAIGYWLAAAAQGTVNWIGSSVSQTASWLSQTLTADFNSLVNADLAIALAIQGGYSSGGGGTCGSGVGGLFGFLLQILGCDFIGHLTDLLNNIVTQLSNVLQALFGPLSNVLMTLLNDITGIIEAIVAGIVAIVGALVSLVEYLINMIISLVGLLGSFGSMTSSSLQAVGDSASVLAPDCTQAHNIECLVLSVLDNTVFQTPYILDLMIALMGMGAVATIIWDAGQIGQILERGS